MEPLKDKIQEQQESYLRTYKGQIIKGARAFRVEIVSRMIIDGYSIDEIWRKLSEMFGSSKRTVERYVQSANKKLIEISSKNIEENLGTALTRLNELYVLSKQDKDDAGKFNRRETMDIIMNIARLQRLLDPKTELKGNIGFSINGQSIEQLAMATAKLQQEADSSVNNSDKT